ncbi:MAG: hypothetical protein ACOC4G_10285 [Bacillota bacterium]
MNKTMVIILLVLALVVSFSFAGLAEGAEVNEEDGEIEIITNADQAEDNVADNGEENGKAHNNPLYVAGE